jgi:MarR family transcriptional regulator, organic hydroperoxide resistance regulator
LKLAKVEDINILVSTVGIAATTPRDTAAVPAGSTPADEAWELLRELLFAERRRFFAAAAEFDLHPAQAGTLMHLDGADGLPMHEIATRLACDNSNVTGIVDRLEARDLVARRPGEQDRRVKYIVLTAHGRAVREAMRERMARAPIGIERLCAQDQRLLRDLLARAKERSG